MNRRTFLQTAVAATITSSLAGCDAPTGSPSPSPGTESSGAATTGDGMPTPPTTAPPSVPCNGEPVPYLDAPDGFHVEAYVEESSLGGGQFRPGPEPGPRMMATYGEMLYATIPLRGRVVVIRRDSETGAPSAPEIVLDELERPHGIAFHDEAMYLATAVAIVRYDVSGGTVDPASRTVLVDDVPRGFSHWTRSITIQGDRLYLSAGACTSGRCSAGNEAYLGAITGFDLDGSNRTTYATGLRNAVGIGWHDGNLFATDNGVDGLGPDRPPDEVNVVREGAHYGFPACYGDNVPDPNHADGESDCQDREPPAATLPPHCAPLGFDFYDGTGFPAEYRGDMYVALHGSWAREEPTGYEIVRIPYEEGALGTPRDFVAGWMPEGGTNEDARGRPVDVHVGADGAMYVTDDLSGSVYRVCYEG